MPEIRERAVHIWTNSAQVAHNIRHNRDADGFSWDDCSFLSWDRDELLFMSQKVPATDTEIIGFMRHHGLGPKGKARNKIAPPNWSQFSDDERRVYCRQGSIPGDRAFRPRKAGR